MPDPDDSVRFPPGGCLHAVAVEFPAERRHQPPSLAIPAFCGGRPDPLLFPRKRTRETTKDRKLAPRCGDVAAIRVDWRRLAVAGRCFPAFKDAALVFRPVRGL